MQLILITLASVALSVCSTFAQPTIPYNKPDIVVNKVFGRVVGKPSWDKVAFDSKLKPAKFWVDGTVIRINTFGIVSNDLRTNPPTETPIGYGAYPVDLKMLVLDAGEHVVNVICAFSGNDFTYFEMITNKKDKDGNYRSTSGGAKPETITEDMKESAPEGKELSGFVVFMDGEFFAGVGMIWTPIIQ